MLKSLYHEYELFLCTDDGWLEARVVAFDGTVRRSLENTARSKCTYHKKNSASFRVCAPV